MLEEVYKDLLLKYREHPLNIFSKSYVEMLLDEVEISCEDEQCRLASRKVDQETGKVQMATYKEENEHRLGKFGRCFYCRREAGHYLKEEWLPICGLNCREKLKAMLMECQGAEPFSLMNWLLDNLPSGDEIILSFLLR